MGAPPRATPGRQAATTTARHRPPRHVGAEDRLEQGGRDQHGDQQPSPATPAPAGPGRAARPRASGRSAAHDLPSLGSRRALRDRPKATSRARPCRPSAGRCRRLGPMSRRRRRRHRRTEGAMSELLYRLGRLAARRPWRVIGAWVRRRGPRHRRRRAVRARARGLFEVPGLDSQQAAELLADGRSSTRAGLTAQRRARRRGPDAAAQPRRPESSRCSRGSPARGRRTTPAASRRTAGSRRARAVSGDRGARPGRPGALKASLPTLRDGLAAADRDGRRPLLRVRGAGDRARRGARLVAAMVILLVAFGSVVAMGLPIGMALFGLVVGVSSLSLVDLPRRHPQLGAAAGSHGRPRGGHRLRAVPGHPAPRAPAPWLGRRGGGRAWRPPGRLWSSPAARSSSRFSAWPSPASRS